MSKLTRRDLLQSAAFIGGTLLPSAFASQAADAKSTVSATYVPRPLPFKASTLKGLSERLIVSHHDKNYVGAVKRIAAIQDKIRQLPGDAPPFQMGSLKREELIATNSMILHEYYFDNLGGDGRAGGDIERLIKEQFGAHEAWEAEFKQTGMSLAGGSGWVILSYGLRDRRLYNVWSSDHTQGLADARPMLVMDMYEHSYQMDYGADAKSYIDAFFQNINWQQVDDRLKQVKP